MALQVPILFCVFNRPEHTRRVFESIRRQRPQTLLLVADGPRDIPGESNRVARTREIISKVDWPCEVLTNFSSTNMGCRQRIATGINWGFEQCEQLIILEDDCLPHDSFYGYCETLLKRFEHNPEVMLIGGNNFQPERRTPHSYFFSRWAHIWGWASWRRAWQHYDLELKEWQSPGGPKQIQFDSKAESDHWSHVFDLVANNKIDTWDFSLQHAVCKNDGLAVYPEKNLVSNIGFGPDATHTIIPTSRSNLPALDIGELRHNPMLKRNLLADRWTFENVFYDPAFSSQPPKRRTKWYRRLLKSVYEASISTAPRSILPART